MASPSPSARSTGGFRLYTEDDVERLRFVKTLKPLDLGLGGGKGIDAPDAAILILFQDGIGHPLQQRIGIPRSNAGFGCIARPMCDYLNCGL